MFSARRACSIVVSAVFLAALPGLPCVAQSAAAESIPTVQSEFDKPGPYAVVTSVRTSPCKQSIAGMIAHITVTAFGNRDDLRCTGAFPYGLESPVGVAIYFPKDIRSMEPAPLIIWTGGITSNPGNYDALAKQWASFGFIVVIPYDFANSLAYLPSIGLAVAMGLDHDRQSPLHSRVDLSRTIFGGHSAGGQAAIQAVSLIPPVARQIDPKLRVVGALLVAPGPLGIGSTIHVPSLFLTGMNDIVAPDFGWVRWWQYNLATSAPSWIANSRGVAHFSPVDGPGAYRASGIAIGWLRYIAFGDTVAEKYFVGPKWGLTGDPAFYSVERNQLARQLMN